MAKIFFGAFLDLGLAAGEGLVVDDDGFVKNQVGLSLKSIYGSDCLNNFGDVNASDADSM